MMAAQPSSPSSPAGFTLIELLVVVAILSLVASVAMPYFARGGSDSLRLRSTASDFLTALRLTRASAILGNAEATLVIDVEKHTFEAPTVPKRTFEPDVVARLKIAEPERQTPSRGGFRFFPDGSSTGGDLSLRLHGHEAKICVNWLTGEARQGVVC
jgi:general secretion pathway protein H